MFLFFFLVYLTLDSHLYGASLKSQQKRAVIRLQEQEQFKLGSVCTLFLKKLKSLLGLLIVQNKTSFSVIVLPLKYQDYLQRLCSCMVPQKDSGSVVPVFSYSFT